MAHGVVRLTRIEALMNVSGHRGLGEPTIEDLCYRSSYSFVQPRRGKVTLHCTSVTP